MNAAAAWTPICDDLLADTCRSSASVEEVRRRLVVLNAQHDHRRLLATPTWAAGLYWLGPPDPLAPILPTRFDVTDRPHQSAGGCTVVVIAARQLRVEHPLPRLQQAVEKQPAPGPRMARRNRADLHLLDFGSAAKVTPFASDVEKVQDGLFQQPASEVAPFPTANAPPNGRMGS